MLRDDLACPVEVVNAGVSGYGTIEELDYFEHEGLALDPDVVLIYYIENDNLVVLPRPGQLSSFVKDWVIYRSELAGATVVRGAQGALDVDGQPTRRRSRGVRRRRPQAGTAGRARGEPRRAAAASPSARRSMARAWSWPVIPDRLDVPDIGRRVRNEILRARRGGEADALRRRAVRRCVAQQGRRPRGLERSTCIRTRSRTA